MTTFEALLIVSSTNLTFDKGKIKFESGPVKSLPNSKALWQEAFFGYIKPFLCMACKFI
jgi:hypothetical protein